MNNTRDFQAEYDALIRAVAGALDYLQGTLNDEISRRRAEAILRAAYRKVDMFDSWRANGAQRVG